MEVSDSILVGAPAARVWELFWDFPRLASCMPGCEDIETIDDSSFKARVKQSVGPFHVEMQVTFNILEVSEGSRIVVAGSGTDRRGNMLKFNRATLELTPISADETEVSYVVDVTLFGRLGTLGYPIVKRKARDLGAQFTRRIIDELDASPKSTLDDSGP